MKANRGRLFDHVHLKVKNIERSKKFYRPVIEALGLNMSYENLECFCIDELFVSESIDPSRAIHLAFQAEHPGAVRMFYETAIKNGGRGNGGPEVTLNHLGQYTARVLDPDGNHIEAVFQQCRNYTLGHPPSEARM